MIVIWTAIREGSNAYLKRQFRTIAIIAIIISLVIVAGFGFGASLAALFAQLGGGIFTKSADVGADLVGKVEENFPEDDPRNPAAIADNVGDNVGDEAGRGADLFESLTAENLGGMIIGLIVSIILFQGISSNNVYYVTMPLIVRSLGIVATFVGLAIAIYEKKFKNPIKPTRDGLLVASLVAAILLFIATWYVFGPSGLTPSGSALAAYALYGCMVSGLAAGLLIVIYTEFYTGSNAKPVITIAERSKSGPALTIMSGNAVGMISSGLPVITVAIALLISFGLGEQFAGLIPALKGE